MLRKVLLALLFFATSLSAHVLEMTDDMLATHLVANYTWAILLYADWCGACKRFHPHFQTLAATYSDDVGTKFAKINIVDNGMASSRFFVQYLPTVIRYQDMNDTISVYTIKTTDMKVMEETLKRPDIFEQPWKSYWIHLGYIFGYLNKYFLLIFGLTLCALAALVWWSSYVPEGFEFEDQTVAKNDKKRD